VLVTYAIDCYHEHAASVGLFVNLVRSTWGFISESVDALLRIGGWGDAYKLMTGPLWFPDMFDSIGLKQSAGLMVGILFVFVILPVVFIQLRGGAIRERERRMSWTR